jgi:hypothetical protein
MSKFLGPIHHWLYNKIQLQQEIIDDICELGEDYGLSLKQECDDRYGVFENKPLEEAIDSGNIHGWLQERVSQVEYKYAYCITRLLDRNPEEKERLLWLHRRKGNNLAVTLKEYLLDAQGIFQAVTDHLLDGMPCDHANRTVSQSGQEVVWSRENCVHKPYWEAVGADINIYYELRGAWLDGLVSELGYCFERLDDHTCRIREAILSEHI